MSKLTKLVRDPRMFLADSKAYHRWRRMRHHVAVDEKSFPLRELCDQSLGKTLLAKMSEQLPLVETSERGETRLAIRRRDLDALTWLLRELGRRKDLTVMLRVHNREVGAGEASLLELDELARSEPSFEARIVSQRGRAFVVCFEVWEEDGSQYVGPRDNRDARRVSLEAAAEHGFFVKGSLPSVSSLHAWPGPHEVEFPIDAVYTWVNHDDPSWQALWRQSFGDPVRDDDEEDKSLARFQSRDELRYSLRSLDQFAPWIRHIYIVSNCLPPSWLNLDSPRVSWVDHKEIFPPDALPTFNSHAIESRLHLVPGLAQHFLYVNDDVLLLRPAEPGDFFFRTGIAKSFLEEYGSVSGDVSQQDPAYLNAARNGKQLLEREFSCSVRALHKHTIFALRRDVLEDLSERFREKVDATTRGQLRTHSDLSTASFLAHHFGYLTGRAVPFPSDSILVKPTSLNYERTLVQILEGKKIPSTVCLNDGAGDSSSQERWSEHVVGFMARYFRSPSSFEKPDSGDRLP